MQEVIQNNRRTRIETVFAPPPAGLWLDKLQVLDLGEQPLRQTAALPVLTHLICSLPLEDVLNPDYYPALQQLIITNMFPDNGSSFARLHECRVRGSFSVASGASMSVLACSCGNKSEPEQLPALTSRTKSCPKHSYLHRKHACCMPTV